MKKILWILGLGLVLGLWADGLSIPFSKENVIVTDGDTVKITIVADNCPDVVCKDLPVRISGIDTPEKHGQSVHEQQLAVLAKDQMVRWLVNSNDIYFYNCKRDKYFRLNCSVKSNQGEYADFIIKKRLAIPYNGGTKTYDWSLHQLK